MRGYLGSLFRPTANTQDQLLAQARLDRDKARRQRDMALRALAALTEAVGNAPAAVYCDATQRAHLIHHQPTVNAYETAATLVADLHAAVRLEQGLGA